jgi:hypothetical protein
MAEHAAPEYATASGNDYASHESTYESFVQWAFIGTVHVATILIGLAIGGVLGHWFTAAFVSLIATAAAGASFVTNTRVASYGALVLALLALAMSAG